MALPPSLSDPVDLLARIQSSGLAWRDREETVQRLFVQIDRQGPHNPLLACLEALARDSKWEVRKAVADGLLALPEDALVRFAGLLRADDNRFVRNAVERALDRHRKGLQAQFRRRKGILEVQDQYAAIQRQHGDLAAERARRMAERLYEVIVGGTVHELRGIITPLLSMAESLAGQVQTGRIDGAWLKTHAPAHLARLRFVEDLIEDMGAFFQGTPPERQPECLRVLVDEALRLVLEWFAGRGLDLGPVAIAIEVPDTIVLEASRRSLVIALRNLIKNAIESLADSPRTFRPGKVRLHAEIAEEMVVLIVSDTGSGLSPTELAEVEQYVPGKASKKAHGTGFGLPIAYRKITDHGGAMRITSQEDRGTTITVTIPLEAPEEPFAC